MRILFLTQVLPLPLDAGPKVRAYYVLKYLAQAGHEVDLLSFVRPGDSDQYIQSLSGICHSVQTVRMRRSRFQDLSHGIRSLASRTPFLILRDQVAEMRDAVLRAAGNRSMDAIHADQLWMAPYGLECPHPKLSVLDQHNAVFVAVRRLADQQSNPLAKALLRREAEKLEAYERASCDRFDQVVWVTGQDQKAVGSDNGHRRRECVIPIAIDASARQPWERNGAFRVTFLGGMHWPPNREGVSWFVRDVWPSVAHAVPNSMLTVIGRKPPGAIEKLGRESRVEITGYVADPEPYLRETAVFVVPLRAGAGMRVKILDAWCCGLPVVSTSLGAEGIRAIDGENILLADDARSFAESVIRVMQDRTLARRLAANGRSAAEDSYDWKKVYRAWDEIYH
jgi:glycosyltransferase involved in cell wall biosynthesis